MESKAVSDSLKIAWKVTRTSVRVSAKVARTVARGANKAYQARQAREANAAAGTQSQPTPSAPSSPPARSGAPSTGATSNGSVPGEPMTAPEARADTPITASEAQADTPITPEAANVKTVDDRDELVGEFAESGAEDGAGATLEMAEPFSGYDSANVEAVKARIAEADAAELALIELYEQAHKARKGVLEAAAKRLKTLSASS